MSRAVLLLAFCVAAVAASTAFDSSLGAETANGAAVNTLDLWSLVTPNSALIWNKSEHDIGKVTDVEENMGKGEIILGSSYHKAQVTVVDLFSGAVTAHHAPGTGLHSYSVETSAEGALVVLGCPETGAKCHVFAFHSLDPAATPMWQKEIPGNLFHTHHAFKLSDDGQVMAIVTLNERPHKHVPLPGKLHWLKGSDGTQIGEQALTRTLGEVFLDADHGALVATRQFAHEHDGELEVFDTKTNKKIQSIPDRFSRFGVSPNLHDVAIPKTGHEHSFDVHSATTGAVEWSYSAPSGEFNNGLVIGRSQVVASYFRHHGVPEFVFRVFATTQSAKVGVPHLTFNITLPHHAEAHGAHFVVSDDQATSELAFAVPGVGIFHAPLGGAHVVPEMLFHWPDRCGFHGVKVVRHATKGTVVVAVLNRREHEGCSFSTDVVALNTPLRR